MLLNVIGTHASITCNRSVIHESLQVQDSCQGIGQLISIRMIVSDWVRKSSTVKYTCSTHHAQLPTVQLLLHRRIKSCYCRQHLMLKGHQGSDTVI